MPKKSSKTKKSSKGKKKWQPNKRTQSPLPPPASPGNEESLSNHQPCGLQGSVIKKWEWEQILIEGINEELPEKTSHAIEESIVETLPDNRSDKSDESNVEHVHEILYYNHENCAENIFEHTSNNTSTIEENQESFQLDDNIECDISVHNPNEDNVDCVEYTTSETKQDDEGSLENIPDSDQGNARIEAIVTTTTTIATIQENESSDNAMKDDKDICENIQRNDKSDDDEINATFNDDPVNSDSDCNYSDCETEDENLCLEEGRGVCVVSAGGAGARWRLQRAALAALLARPGVAERPVVVVSVAGAFRGGKSFLLDYMLRYLYSKAGARGAPGDWLGGAREPLRGFSWRNGSAPDTTGLVLWSQPVPVTLPSGEQVVVLLMDTQGAFDENSSIADCSLVFALSTLLSSVQIYNVSRRLDESDLQHLQLFTEYAAQCGGALQELQVLVRDWSAPYEFPFGAAGGAAYLRDKLQVKEEQPRESREIRQRLSSSFERVGCFLLPHPGITASSDPNFRGELADLREEFKQSLEELVPLIMAPENLRVKAVEGQPLRAGQLAAFLEAYLDEFRDRVPSPQSVLSATARARWLTAAAAARAALCGPPPARALSRAEPRARRAAALHAALAPLAPLAERAGELDALAAIEQELDELLSQRIAANDRAVELAAARGREAFEGAARALLADAALCVPPRALAPALQAACDAAHSCFLQDVDATDEDPDLVEMMIDLEERCKPVLARLREVNAANNSLGVAAARAALAGAVRARPCAGAAALAGELAAARAAARAAFRARRQPPDEDGDDGDDPYLTQLEQVIDDFLLEHEAKNEYNNKRGVAEALRFYKETVNLNAGCWKPQELQSTHTEKLAQALELFYRKRQDPCREPDDYTKQIEQGVQRHFSSIQPTNRFKNNNLVEAVFKMFTKRMRDSSSIFRVTSAELNQQLTAAYDKGIEDFLNESVPSRSRYDNADEYLCKLQQKMRDEYDKYRERNDKLPTGGEVATAALATAGALAAGAAASAAAGAAGGVLAAAARLFR